MRVAVIGSGLAGLLSSALLRRAGVDVVRFERASHEGGRARSPTLGGVPVNSGPRAIYRAAPLARALASFGIEPRGFRPPVTGALAIVDGALAPLPGSLTELLGASLLDAAAKRAFAMALARVTVGALDVEASMSIGTWLDHHGGPLRSRQLLATLVRVATYADSELIDAQLALQQLRRAVTKGVMYVDGGWQSVVDALLPHAGAAAQQRTVTSLAELTERQSAFDRVLVALPAAETRALVAGLPEVAPPSTAACLDVVLERLPQPRRRVAFGVDQPTYFSVHTAPERVAAGNTRIIVHAMAYGEMSRAQLESMFDLVQPGWRNCVVDARYLPRMIVSSSLPRAGTPRTPQRLEDERVYFAGDHVDSRFLLADGTAQSAVDAARAIAAGLGDDAARNAGAAA